MAKELNNELKEFVSAHLAKSSDSDIVYNGDISMLQGAIDSAVADVWYEKNKDVITFEKYSIDHLGKVHDIAIPVFSNIKITEGMENLSQDYKVVVNNYMKSGMITDKRGLILFKLLNTFDVVTDGFLIAFMQKKDVNLVDNLIKSKSTVSSVEVGGQLFNVDVTKMTDIKRYENIMLLFKEVQDGFYDVRSHSLTDKQNGTLIQQEYKLGQDVFVKINSKTKEVISVEQYESKYNAEKDGHGRWVLTPERTRLQGLIDTEKAKRDKDGKSLANVSKIRKWKKLQEPERVNTKDFESYKSYEEGDVMYIEMYGAYTHILRDILDFKPLTWQYRLLLNWNRFNVLAGCRRAGKTRLSAYLILRLMWMMPNSIKHVQRQVKGTYIAPTEEKMKEVIDYIKTTSEAIRLMKVLDFNKKESRLYLYDEQVGRKQKIVMTVATCDFASGKGFEPGRGKASDLVIIDEAAFVKEDVWLNILPILDLEGASCFAISTIDWSTPRNWFYELLVDLEKGFDKEGFGMRVTIDDLDEVLVTQVQKDRMKRALKNNIQRYYAELYATFPNMQSVFNVSGFFGLNKELGTGESIQEVIIGYDPAKRTDVGALIVSELRSGPQGDYVFMYEERALSGEFTGQKEIVQGVKQYYVEQGIPTYVIIDATAAGDVVAEIFGNIIDYKIWYTAKGKRPEIDKFGAWKVPKNNLVHLTQILIEKGRMSAHIGMKTLMDELKYFKAITTQHGNTKYEAETGHDDFVNAMMLIGFYFGYVKGEVYKFSNGMEIQRTDGINNITRLYDSYTARVERRNTDTSVGYGFGA